jgi:membrane protease YdiL (CAAX protease family)
MAWLVLRLAVGKHWPAIVALRRPSLPHVLFALAGLPGLMVITMGIDGLAKQFVPSLFDLEEMMGMFGKWPWPIGVLIIGVGPGIGEELWCRGFLGRGLVGRYGYLGGVLLTSLLFGVIHLEPRQVAYAMVMGVFLHCAYLFTRSLLVPILIHMTNNSLSVLALHIPQLQAIDMPANQIPWTVYAAGILLTAAVGWALFQSRARLVDLPSANPTSITTIASPTSITNVPYEIPTAEQPLPTWRPAFPSVAYPPPGKATRVMHPWPAWHSWLLVAVGLALFVGSCFLGG